MTPLYDSEVDTNLWKPEGGQDMRGTETTEFGKKGVKRE
jgi:hypothetical protein